MRGVTGCQVVGVSGEWWHHQGAGRRQPCLCAHAATRRCAWHFGLWRCAFSPDGSRLATVAGDEKVAIWKVPSWEVERVLRGHGAGMLSCAWSSDGTHLVAVHLDKTVKVWRVADGSVVHTLKGHTRSVFDVCFSPDDTMVASAAGDDTMKLWRVAPVGGGGGGGDGGGTAAITPVAGGQEWRCVRTFRHPNCVLSCAFSPTRDGTRMRLVSGCDDGRVRVWEVAGAGGAPGGSSSVSCTGGSSDSEQARTGSDSVVHVPVLTLEGHSSWVRSCGFSVDGEWLCTASATRVSGCGPWRTARVWQRWRGTPCTKQCSHLMAHPSCPLPGTAPPRCGTVHPC